MDLGIEAGLVFGTNDEALAGTVRSARQARAPVSDASPTATASGTGGSSWEPAFASFFVASVAGLALVAAPFVQRLAGPPLGEEGSGPESVVPDPWPVERQPLAVRADRRPYDLRDPRRPPRRRPHPHLG